jgi:hypothetical protein
VIRSKEVGVLRQGGFVRIVSIQLFRQNHVSKFEFAINVCQTVPVMRKLGKKNIIIFLMLLQWNLLNRITLQKEVWDLFNLIFQSLFTLKGFSCIRFNALSNWCNRFDGYVLATKNNCRLRFVKRSSSNTA